MDRSRFEHLLSAYGADLSRWPPDERAAAQALAAQGDAEIAALIEEARVLDEALEAVREAPLEHELLARRILKAAPGAGFDRRALWALAACAVLGILLGYGGGRLAAPAPGADDYFAMAFESPFGGEGG